MSAKWMTHRHVSWPLRHCGLLALLDRCAKHRGLIVLNYHRIGNPADAVLDDATFSATADDFRLQVKYAQKHFKILTTDELLDALATGRFAHPSACFTFDDGYRDNYEAAFPILRDLGVTASFFVVPGYVDNGTLPWWDRVAYTMKRTSNPTVRISYPKPLEFDLRQTSRAKVSFEILRAYKRATAIDQDRFFDELAEATGVDVDTKSLAQGLLMSWAEAKEMQAKGMTIGSHTMSHPVLASISEERQRRELVDSRARIAEATGIEPDILAYPVGGPSAFTEVTKRLAKEAGYRAAFSFIASPNLPPRIDHFSIGRVAVEHANSFSQFAAGLTAANLALAFG